MLELEYINDRLFVRFSDIVVFNWGPFHTKTEAFDYASKELKEMLSKSLEDLRARQFRQKPIRVCAERISCMSEGVTLRGPGYYNGQTVRVGDWFVDGYVYTDEQFTKRFEQI